MAPTPGGERFRRFEAGSMAVVGDCDIRSAGFWTLEDGITSFTLAEHLQSPLLSDGFESGDSSAWSATVP